MSKYYIIFNEHTLCSSDKFDNSDKLNVKPSNINFNNSYFVCSITLLYLDLGINMFFRMLKSVMQSGNLFSSFQLDQSVNFPRKVTIITTFKLLSMG